MIYKISSLEVWITLVHLWFNFLNFKKTRDHVVIEVVIVEAAYDWGKEEHQNANHTTYFWQQVKKIVTFSYDTFSI